MGKSVVIIGAPPPAFMRAEQTIGASPRCALVGGDAHAKQICEG